MATATNGFDDGVAQAGPTPRPDHPVLAKLPDLRTSVVPDEGAGRRSLTTDFRAPPMPAKATTAPDKRPKKEVNLARRVRNFVLIGAGVLVAAAALFKGPAREPQPDTATLPVARQVAQPVSRPTLPATEAPRSVVVPVSLTLSNEDLRSPKPSQPLIFSLWPVHLDGSIDFSEGIPDRDLNE